MSLLTSMLTKSAPVSNRQWTIAGATHVGLVRSLNEDSYIFVNRRDDSALLLGVADGMGGHEFGEIASYLVMRYLLAGWNALPDHTFTNGTDAQNYLTMGLSRANEHLFHVNRELRIRWAMGTTATIGIVVDQKLIIGHVGDSRAYRLRKDRLTQLTLDQNWKEEMVRNGILGEREAAAHPFANMLTNCVGALRDLRLVFQTFPLAAGDRYLFCTDGLSTMVPGRALRDIMAGQDTPQGVVDESVRQALQHGGNDNVTAVCLYL